MGTDLTLLDPAAHPIEHRRKRAPPAYNAGNFGGMGITGGIACCVLFVAIVGFIAVWQLRNRLGPKQPPPPPPDDPTAPRRPGQL
jgi:hypothetical protein